MRATLGWFLAFSLFGCCWGCNARTGVEAGTPPIFDKRPYEQAKAAAEAQNKWFIVKATAEWCGPCKRMDATTWRDDAVVKWLTDNAIAAVFDVDAQEDLSKELAIEAMPTMIAFKDGSEFDRIVGYRDPADMLAWLAGLARGEKSITAVIKKAGEREPADGKKVDVQARLALARSLVQSGKLDEAADEYEWLWRNMLNHEPAMYGVRLSFMAGDMENLAAKSDKARARFTTLRDETRKSIESGEAPQLALSDFLVLNKVIGDKKATLDWFETIKDQHPKPLMFSLIAMELEPLLIAEKRWADLGKLYDDPVAEIERQDTMNKMLAAMTPADGLTPQDREEVNAVQRKSFQSKAGTIYAGLLAADRDELADRFAGRARELDSSSEMLAALVSTALDAGEPRQVQLDWLQGVANPDGGVKQLAAKTSAALQAGK